MEEDIGKILTEVIQKNGKSVKEFTRELSNATDQTKMMADVFEQVADKLKRTDEYTVKLSNDLIKVNKFLGTSVKLTDELRAANQSIVKLAQTNEQVQLDMQDILRGELDARQDMVLQMTMLETGLEGVYANMANTLKLAREDVLTKIQTNELTKELINLELKLSIAKERGYLPSTIHDLTTQIAKKKVLIQKEVDLAKTEYNDQVKLLQVRQAQNKVIEKQVSFVKQVAAETLKIKQQTDAYKNKFEGLLATTKAIFSSPAAFFTTVAVALTAVGAKFSETFGKLQGEGLSTGQAITGTFNAYGTSISNLGNISVEQVGQATDALVGMGQTLHEAEEGVDKVADMMTLMGGSAENTGKAFGFLQTMPGQTAASAENIMRMGGAMAKVANVPAATVTEAIAKNMGAAAIAGPKLMKSFAEAAIFAKKIGVEMSVFDTMAKSLLNFEDSINKQMEASVLLGKEINLDKARELALAGDLKGVQHEILKVVGSEAEFNKMNRLQKDALAAAMGVEVTDLQKIIAGKGKETALGKRSLELEEEKANWIQKIGLWGAKNMGSVVSSIASLTASIITMIPQIMTYNLLKAQSTAITATNTPVTTTNAMAIRAAGVAAKGAVTSMLAFGAAVLMIGIGIGIAALGFAQLVKAFGETKNAGMALGAIIAIMGIFAFMVKVLSAASLAAAPGLYTLGGAMLMIGGGIFLATAGMALLIYSLSQLNTEQLAAIPMILTAIVVPMTLLGISFMIMASGLAAMAATSVGVMPLIGSLIMLAGVAAMLGQMGGLSLPSLGDSNKKPAASKESSDGGSFKEVKDALVNLTTAVAGIRGDVKLDGKDVGDAIWSYVQAKVKQETTKAQH